MKTRIFTSGLLVRDGKILILKRGPTAPRHPNRWDSLGGHLNENENAEDCMIREAREEAGINVTIKESGKVYEYNDEYGRAIVIPFLLECDSDKIVLSEHTEYKWVNPEEIKNYDCGQDVIEDAKIFGLIK